MLKFAAALLAGVTASAAAFAGDLPNGYASPGLLRGETAYNWSGIYAGASAGWASDVISPEMATGTFGSSSQKGFIGGVQAGFNKQAGALVVGVEADFSFSNATSGNSRTLAGPYGNYTLAGDGKIDSSFVNLGTVRARVGYAADRVLVYGTAGYAVGRHKMEMSGTFTATSGAVPGHASDAGSGSNTMSGWVAGAGVEYAFARGISVKAEYLRVQFNNSSFFAGSWAETEAKARLNVFRTGVNFRI
jgi:outer membrane immunogenic protein